MLSQVTDVVKTATSPTKVMALMKNPKVMQMVMLFVLLSPGVLLQVPVGDESNMDVATMNMKTSQMSVMVHAVLFYVMLTQVLKMGGNKAMTATMLFVALSPGMLLELPTKDGEVWMTGRTSYEAVALHALIFMVVCGTLC